MISKFFALAASALYLASSVSAQDMFSWDIDLNTPDFPTLNFDAANIDKEITFQYLYSGTYVDNVKYFDITMLAQGCLGAATTLPNALAIKPEVIDSGASTLTFDIDVLQSIIDGSSYYTDNGDNTAAINFCVRVDYRTAAESVNFHETEVTLTVDLTAGFQLTGITAERSAAMETGPLDADVTYDVIAYYCDATNAPLAEDPVYSQGDVMQVCVRVADDLIGQDIYVEDILEFDISQLENGSGPAATPTNAIDNGTPDALTFYDCGADGRCNVMHQLTSKFFDDTTPGSLQVDGVAVLAFGTPAGARRLQRVKVQMRAADEAEQRKLQEGTTSDFGLQAELVGGAPAPESESSSSSNSGAIGIIGGAIAGVAVVALVVAFVAIRRTRKSDDEEEEQKSEKSSDGDVSTDLDSKV